MAQSLISCIRNRRLALLTCFLALSATAAAQNDSGTFRSAASGSGIAVWSRDANGRVVVRATRLKEPLRLDGRLDESVYNEVPAITEFIQQVPDEGAPVTEKTEVWVFYDDTNIYLACRCWDSRPERIVANEMRRDSSNLGQQDRFDFGFDTLHDRRNGYLFSVTPLGGIRDGLTTDEQVTFDWNGVWDGKASRFDQGWIAEAAVPFKTLRYQAARQQTWGLQVRRYIRSKNEMAYLTPVSPSWSVNAVNRMSAAATLVGLELPPPARNFEIKPYAISRLTTDLVGRPAIRNDIAPDAGFDVKYGVTKSMTADFTINTDFAQVEADEAQVNLTRFNLAFPEKREFFLEGQGFFQFGSGTGLGTEGRAAVATADTPSIFYSRSIGLAGGREVPVIAGARLNGKAGAWAIGLLNMETGENDTTAAERANFTVVRLRHDILRLSNVGGIVTRRSVSTFAPGANHVWGLDGNFAFHQNIFLTTYLAQSRTENRRGDDLSYRTQFNYAADRYGLALDRLVVEKHFNPEVGFLRRGNFRRNFAYARFSPRTSNHPVVRRWSSHANVEYITDNDNRLESRELTAQFDADFHNSDTVAVQYQRLNEVLTAPFAVARGVHIPAGGYGFDNMKLSYDAGQQRRVSGATSFEVGSFYSGDKKTLTFRGRVGATPRISVEPNISVNWINLPEGVFTDTVVGGRSSFTMTPRMFVAALVQYSSSNMALSTNLRFRWEYQPGSELFVVYTEGRSTQPPRGTELENRGFVIKINRLFRF